VTRNYESPLEAGNARRRMGDNTRLIEIKLGKKKEKISKKDKVYILGKKGWGKVRGGETGA